MRRYFPGYFLMITIIGFLFPQIASTQFSSKYFLTSDGVQLHYLEAGSGPTLVLVPGWTMPAEIWEHQMKYFSKTNRVIALDPRGQGRSEKPPHGYYPSRRAKDISDLIEHLGDQQIVLAGWSIAGQEVLICAQEHGTSAISAMIVVDWDIIIDNPEGFTNRFISLQTDRESWIRNFVRAIHKSPQSEEYFQKITQAALSMPPNAAAMIIANIILMGPNDLSSAIESIDKPILCIYSSSQWAIEAAQEVRDSWPGVKVEVIPGTAHTLFIDKPNEFNQLLDEFMKSIK